MKGPIIAVFGSGTVKVGDEGYDQAAKLGRAIAEAGWTLCNGGYGGTMAAASLAASEAGGVTVGVTCSVLNRRGDPNPHIQHEVPTYDLLQRVNTLMRIADAYVVLPGGTGTLLELAAVWEFNNKGLLSRKRPVVLLGDFWHGIGAMVRRAQPDAMQLLVASEVADVIDVLRQALPALD